MISQLKVLKNVIVTQLADFHWQLIQVLHIMEQGCGLATPG